MNTKILTTVAVVVLASLVLTASGPTTFSWFSDSNETEIDVNIANVVKNDTYGGVFFNLEENGTLTVSPVKDTVPDKNSGKVFEEGAWREAVVYKSNGDASAIGGYPYDVNAVKSLVIEEGVTSIGSFTAKFPNLTGEVVIPASVTYIGQEAFQKTKITKLTFAEGGTENLCIAAGAFKSLAIKEIVLPDDRPEIHLHSWVFQGCNMLENVTIPKNVYFLGHIHVDYDVDAVYGYDSQVFSSCTSLKKMTFESQAVHDRFFNAPNNRGNIGANVEIIILNNQNQVQTGDQ